MTSTTNLSLTLTRQPVLPLETMALLGEYGYEAAISGAFGRGPETLLLDDSSNTNNTVFLWELGCLVNGTPNCTSSCLDPHQSPSLVWNSPESMLTLHNCLLYPILATAAAHGWLVEDPPGLMGKFNISSSDILPIDFNGTLINPPAWSAVHNCVYSMCKLLDGTQADDRCTFHNTPNYTAYTLGPAVRPWTPYLVRLVQNLISAGEAPADSNYTEFVSRPLWDGRVCRQCRSRWPWGKLCMPP